MFPSRNLRYFQMSFVVSLKGVRLEYSDNYGLVWRSLPEECLPGEEVDCYAFQLHSELLSRATGYRRIITLPLPIDKGLQLLIYSTKM